MPIHQPERSCRARSKPVVEHVERVLGCQSEHVALAKRAQGARLPLLVFDLVGDSACRQAVLERVAELAEPVQRERQGEPCAKASAAGDATLTCLPKRFTARRAGYLPACARTPSRSRPGAAIRSWRTWPGSRPGRAHRHARGMPPPPRPNCSTAATTSPWMPSATPSRSTVSATPPASMLQPRGAAAPGDAARALPLFGQY